jgi:hypothetical protein
MKKLLANVLLCGWFLISPPIKSDVDVDDRAPLGQWYHTQSFDTARECENAIGQTSAKSREAAKQQPDNRSAQRLALMHTLSRCVPSDHVRR